LLSKPARRIRDEPGAWRRQPRELEPALTSMLRRTAPLMGRLSLAKMPGRVVLRTPDGKTVLTPDAARPSR
jgi:hypothetical protein